MNRSAIRAILISVALLLFSACGPPEGGELSEKAHAAWKLYLSEPGPGTYENFIRANRAAAGKRNSPHDAVGIEYQLRALEVMAAESERANDARLAEDVIERVEEIEGHDLVGVYEETLPGAKSRLAAAKTKASAVSR
jgi:hypothetical protein